MSDTFVEGVHRLHDAGRRLITARPEDAILELFAESSFREHLTLFYGRRGTHEGPSELYDHHDLTGTALRFLSPSEDRFVSIDSLRPEKLTVAADELLPSARTRPDRPHLGVSDEAECDREIPHEIMGAVELPEDAPDAVTLDEKRHLLQAAADAALSLDPSLTELEVSFQGVVRRIYVWATDVEPVIAATAHVGIRVFAASAKAAAYAVGGAPGGIGHFLKETPESIAASCIKRLRALEEAHHSPEIRGEMPIVLAGGWGGVWLHETVGHLLEADSSSPLAPKAIGRRIGSELVTIADDGTLADGRGTSPIDDEGTPTQRTTLVENGILRRLITDRATARRTGLPKSANGRRQDYRYKPLPRMSNLILSNGSTSPSDLLKDVEYGLYVRMIGGGEVRPKNDEFQFSILEGHLIENGALTAPLTSLTISGQPSTMLQRIVGVGDDFKIDPARGTCLKAGQSVPVSVGMPSVLLDSAAVTPAS